MTQRDSQTNAEVERTLKEKGIEIGKTYEVRYPFKLEEVGVYNDYEVFGDFCGTTVTKQEWRQGARRKCRYPDDDYLFADGEGTMLLHVVGTCKLPGKYMERVFYTRKWICPDGSEVGRSDLRVSTLNHFIARASGFYYDYETEAEDDAA